MKILHADDVVYLGCFVPLIFFAYNQGSRCFSEELLGSACLVSPFPGSSAYSAHGGKSWRGSYFAAVH